jgi:hypothetical protein
MSLRIPIGARARVNDAELGPLCQVVGAGWIMEHSDAPGYEGMDEVYMVRLDHGSWYNEGGPINMYVTIIPVAPDNLFRVKEGE